MVFDRPHLSSYEPLDGYRRARRAGVGFPAGFPGGFLLALSVLALHGEVLAEPADVNQVVPPSVVHQVNAVYPEAARAEGTSGKVVLLVTVDVDGHVSDMEIRESAGHDLDEAAKLAARQWRFEPARRGDRVVKSRILVPFQFAPPVPAPAVNESTGTGSPGVQPGPTDTGSVAIPGTPNTEPDQSKGVTVHGQAAVPSRGASDFTYRVGSLAVVPRKNATELLSLAPGILLTNEGGDGHAEQVFLRGFDAREGQDIEFRVGGVPINEVGNLHGNGYADTHFIIPELVKTLRVVEGPFDPRQGNFAVAGSAEYELGLPSRGATVKATYGSFGSERLLVLWGPEGAPEHTFGGAELYQTNGFGQNRDSRRGSAMGQYEGRIGDGGVYHLAGTAYANRYHGAGVLRDDDVRTGRIGFYDTYDFRQGGDGTRFSLAADVEVPYGETLYRQQFFLIARGMRLRENFTGFLLDPQTPLQNPHSQRGDLFDLDVSETTLGMRGSSRSRTRLWGLGQELEIGYFARGDAVQGTQRQIEAATNHPYRVDADVESRLADLGVYVDGNLRLTQWLALRGGVRGDLFTFNVQDNCAVHAVAHPSKSNPPGDASCLSQQDFGRYRDPTQRASTASTVLLPRGSVILGPFRGISYNLSYGQGVRSIDPSYITEDAETPFARIKAYELGTAYTASTETLLVTARSVFFQTQVDRDLIFSETEGRNLVGGGTTRTGWVGAIRLTHENFDQAANVTLVRSTFDDTHLLVPYVPDVVMRSDTAALGSMPFRIAGNPVRGIAGLGITYVGHRALPYGQRSDAIFTLDVSASFRWSIVDLGLMATNILDRQYRLGEYNFASDFHTAPAPTLAPVRHFSAGAPRAVFATVGINWGAS